MPQAQGDVPVEICTQNSNVQGGNRTYRRDLQIGRKPRCDVQVESGVVSRVHAKIVYEGGRWWVVDDGSTNGTYLDGEQIDRAPLPAEAEMQLGEDGPTFRLTLPGSGTQREATDPSTETHLGSGDRDAPTERTSLDRDAQLEAAGPDTGAERPRGSVTQYVQHYFENDDPSGGEHTRKVRRAYRRVQRKERRSYLWAVAGALGLCLLLGGYALWQHQRNEQIRDQAREVFTAMKEQDLIIANLRRRIEESNDESLQAQLVSIEEAQRKQRGRYKEFVRELGVRRELTSRERVIYETAFIFGESEFGIPAGFVRKVKETIETYWKRPEGRSRLVSAIRRAEEQNYTGFIVNTMREHSLPPEFFYLALQESEFNVNAIGPRTEWGIAKGMWQFIPATAREYGLRVGPRKDQPVVDRQDERHDFKKSTRAAARYLQEIYRTQAQASGLLVIASYNWGERRVVDKLEHLPKGIPESALEGVPESPEERNYWQFLKKYSDRMPEETKDYVLKVVSAAVICRNPQLFGFDFENPLREHMNGRVAQTVASPDSAESERPSSTPPNTSRSSF